MPSKKQKNARKKGKKVQEGGVTNRGALARTRLATGIRTDKPETVKNVLDTFMVLSLEEKAQYYLEFATFDDKAWTHGSADGVIPKCEAALSQAFLSMAHSYFRQEFLDRPSSITKGKRDVQIMAGKFRDRDLSHHDDPESGHPGAHTSAKRKAMSDDDDTDSVPDFIDDDSSSDDDVSPSAKSARNSANDIDSESGDSVPDLIEHSDSDNSDNEESYNGPPFTAAATASANGAAAASAGGAGAGAGSVASAYRGPALAWDEADGVWTMEQWKLHSQALCEPSTPFVEYLRYCATVSFTWLHATLMQVAAMHGAVKCARFLLSDNVHSGTRREWSYALCLACEYGRANIVKVLLKNSEVIDIDLVKDEAIVRACRKNGSEQVLALLLAHDRINPATQSNKPLETAVVHGRSVLAKMLIDDSRVDASAFDNKAMDACIKHNNEEVASYLLNSGAVASDPRLIAQASVYGCHGIVSLLKSALTEKPVARSSATTATAPRVSAAAKTQKAKAFKKACQDGDHDLVKKMLQDGSVDPKDDNSYSIRASSMYGHASIVSLLLQDKRAEPAATESYALKAASKGGNLEVVKLLLDDGRADPSISGNYAARSAMKNKHFEVAVCLLLDSRVECADVRKWATKLFFPPSPSAARTAAAS